MTSPLARSSSPLRPRRGTLALIHGLLLVLAAVLGQMAQATEPAAAPAPSSLASAVQPRPPSAALQAAVQTYEARRFAAARRAFEKLARAGDAAAQHNLAVMHLRGEVPHPDLTRAVALLEQSAAGGFVTAQYALGQLYDGSRLGRPDPARALSWYSRAAEAGSTAAQVEVATAYYLGRGVAADAAVAAGWYRQAANAGDVGAQYLLASMYETGLGVGVDTRLALYWYEAAGRNGDSVASAKARALQREMDGQTQRTPATSAGERAGATGAATAPI
jgi:TPR repeat protein